MPALACPDASQMAIGAIMDNELCSRGPVCMLCIADSRISPACVIWVWRKSDGIWAETGELDQGLRADSRTHW